MATQEELIFIMKMRDEATSVLRKNSGEVKKLGQEAERSKRTLTDMATAAKVAATAIAGIATTSATIRGTLLVYKDFEKGILDVSKTTGIAGRNLEQLDKQLLDLTQTLPAAATELTGIATVAGQLGIKGTQNILTFTETLAKLQTTSDLVGEGAANSLAQLLGIFNEDTSEIKRLADVLTELGNNAKGGEARIVSIAQEVARATAVFKIGSTEASAIATAFLELGARAETAGTAVGRVFNAIRKSVLTGGEALETLTELTGLTQDELINLEKKTPVETFDLFIQKLGQLIQSGGDYFQVLKVLGLESEEINKTIVPLAENYEKLAKARELASKAAREGAALDREFAIFVQSLQSELDLLSNAVRAIGIDLGREVAPLVKEVLQTLTSALKELRNQFNELPDDLQTVVAGFVVFTPAILGVAGALAILVKALKLTGSTALAARAAMAGLAILTGPLGIALGTVGALSAAVLILGTNETKAEEATREHKEALDLLKAALDQAKDGTEESRKEVKKLADAHIEAANAALKEAEAELALAQARAESLQRFQTDTTSPDDLFAFGEAGSEILRLQDQIEALKKGITEYTEELQKSARSAKADFGGSLKDIKTEADKTTRAILDMEAAADLIGSIAPAIEATKEFGEAQKVLRELAEASDDQLKKLGVTKEQVAKITQRAKEVLLDETNAIEQSIRASQEEIAILKLDREERDAAKAIMELENQVRRDGIDLLGEEAQQRLALAKTLIAQADAQRRRDSFREEFDETLRDMRVEIQLLGLGNKERERAAELINIARRAEKAGIQDIIPLLKEYNDLWVRAQRAQQGIEGALAGAKSALNTFVSETKNVYDDFQGFVTRGIDGLADAFAEFAETGIFDWKRLLSSMASEFTRFSVKYSLAKLLEAAGFGDNTLSLEGILGISSGSRSSLQLGASPSNPMWVQVAGGSTSSFGATPTTVSSPISSGPLEVNAPGVERAVEDNAVETPIDVTLPDNAAGEVDRLPFTPPDDVRSGVDSTVIDQEIKNSIDAQTQVIDNHGTVTRSLVQGLTGRAEKSNTIQGDIMKAVTDQERALLQTPDQIISAINETSTNMVEAVKDVGSTIEKTNQTSPTVDEIRRGQFSPQSSVPTITTPQTPVQGDVLGGVTDFFSGVTDSLRTAVRSAQDQIENVYAPAIRGALDDLFGSTTEGIESNVQTATTGFSSIGDEINAKFNGFKAEIADGITVQGNDLGEIPTIVSRNLKEGISSVDMRPAFTGLPQDLNAELRSVIQGGDLGRQFDAIPTDLGTVLSAKVKEAVQTSTLPDLGGDNLNPFLDASRAVAAEAGQSFDSAGVTFSTIPQKAQQMVADLSSGQTSMAEIPTIVQQQTADARQAAFETSGMRQALTTMPVDAQQAASNVQQSASATAPIPTAANQTSSNMQQAATASSQYPQSAQQIATNLQQAATASATAGNNFVSDIGAANLNFRGQIDSASATFGSGLQSSLGTQGGGGLLGIIGSVVGSFGGKFGNIFSQLFGIFQQLISGLGGLFGGGGGGGGLGAIGGIVSSIFHEGTGRGTAGSASAPQRIVPAAAFKNAPRFHDGFNFGPNEMAAIIEKEEIIIPESEVKMLRKRQNEQRVQARELLFSNPSVNSAKDIPFTFNEGRSQRGQSVAQGGNITNVLNQTIVANDPNAFRETRAQQAAGVQRMMTIQANRNN